MFHGKHTFLPLAAALTATALLLTACGGTGGTTSAPAASSGAASSAPAVSGSAPAAAETGQQAQTAPRFFFVQNNADWIETGEVQTTVGIWDETTGTTREAASLKTDYPLQSVCCAADGSVIYYARRGEDIKNDNLLCVYDTKTGETKTLLNGDEKGENGKQTLYGIDYIAQLDDHQLYMTAGTGGGAIAPVSYDLDTGELTKWDWDSDILISCTAQDPQTRTVYGSGWSEKEDYKLLDQLNNGEIEEYGVDSTVYAFNPDGSHEAVYTSKEWFIDDFVVSDSIIVTAQSRISNKHSKHRIVAYDTTNKAETELFADKEVNGNMIALSEDGASLYVEYGGLVKINLSTGKETILYRPEASKPAVEFSCAKVLL